MIPFTLSKDISFELPQDYGELTLSQFYAIRKSKGDILDLLSIVSGLTREQWEQCKDFNIDVRITPFLEWMKEPFNPERSIVMESLKIGDREVKRPLDIKTQTFGQKLALEKSYYKIQAEGGSEIDLIPYALALYFQPAYFNNKYDSDQVEELLPLIMECKLEFAYPIGTFFLNSYAKLLQSNHRNFLMRLVARKQEQGLKDLHSLRSSLQSTRFQKVLINPMRKFFRWITILFFLPFGMRKNNQLIKRS